MAYSLINTIFDEEIPINPDKPVIRIGRAEDNDIVLCLEGYEKPIILGQRQDSISSISRHHGIFYQRQLENGAELEFEDLRSKFGSFFSFGSGSFRKIDSKVLLMPNNLLRLGNKLVYRVVYSNGETLTATDVLKTTLRKTLGRLIGINNGK